MPKTTAMTLDLATDAAAFSRFLSRSANAYRKQHRETVTGIDAFYAMQNGFVDLYFFWTDPDYEPFEHDASRARMANTLARPRWERWHRRSFEAPTLVTTPGGKRVRTKPDLSDPELRMRDGGIAVVKAVGHMLRDCLVDATRAGTFGRLPLGVP